MKKLWYVTAVFGFLLCALPSIAQKKPSETPPFDVYVTNLPPVDQVEILAIKGIEPDLWGKADCTKPNTICTLPSRFPATIVASKVLTSDDAQKVASLWRALQPGNGAGCISPAYAVRFSKNDKVLLTAEVCFHCCNIVLPDSGITSMCGSSKAITSFKEFVTSKVPFPKIEKN